MAQVTIDGVGVYTSYASLAEADTYLAADVVRAAVWAALDPNDKARALVSATRLLARLDWRDGAPSVDAPPDAVRDATCLLAADVAARPALGDGASTASNVKAVGAGTARVEFFSPVAGAPLPAAAYALVRDLLGPAGGSGVDDPSLDGVAYGSESWRESRFDPTDYGLAPTGWPGQRGEP